MNNHNWNNAFPDTPRSFKNKVSLTLNNLPDKKEHGEMENRKIYNKVSFKKRITVTLAAIFVLGTTAFAAGKISSLVSGSSNIPTYTTIPTEKQVNDDFGFNPKIVEKFENGYAFENGYTVKIEGLDEKGNSVGKTKSLKVTYKKDNDIVNLCIENKMLGEKSEQEIVVDIYNDIDLYYLSDTYKFVPKDYEMTEQDKQDEASGKYVFSCGSKKVEISQFKYLSWTEDGIYYSFSATDSDLSQDELVEMAHQVISAK
jgi:hypothetical protein